MNYLKLTLRYALEQYLYTQTFRHRDSKIPLNYLNILILFQLGLRFPSMVFLFYFIIIFYYFFSYDPIRDDKRAPSGKQ